MKHIIDYLGMPLKSNQLIRIFEDYEVDVIYSHDRLNEGTEDQYYASIPELGLQFVFNQLQILKTIFVHTVTDDKFTAAIPENLGLPAFKSPAAAVRYAQGNDIYYTEGKADFLNKARTWIKLEFNKYSLHYEFNNAVLTLVTIQANKS